MLMGDYGFDMLIRLISKGEDSELARRLYAHYSHNEKYAPKLEAVKRGLLSRITPEYLKDELLPVLWESTVNTLSVSKLEDFADCPFRFYMDYVVRARERDVYGLKNTDAGIIAHRLLEMFSLSLKKEGKGWEDADREYADSFVDKHIAEVASEFGSDVYETNRNSAVLGKLADAVKLSLWASMEHIRSGRFRPEYFEIGFGDGRRLPALEIELDGGKILKINGVIDRVDKMLSEDGRVYVRIVDYKSSAKKPDITEIYSGLQLQLVMYMNALCASGDVLPAGMFYFEVNEPALDDKDGGDEDTQDYILSRMAMRGIYDEALEGKLSPVLVQRGRKPGARDILERDSLALTSDELKVIMDYAVIKARSEGGEMAKGRISASPALRRGVSACRYCPYESVCGFDIHEGSEYNETESDRERATEEIKSIVEENKNE